MNLKSLLKESIVEEAKIAKSKNKIYLELSVDICIMKKRKPNKGATFFLRC